ITDPLNPVPVLGNVSVDEGLTAVVFTPVQLWQDAVPYRITVNTSPIGLDGAPIRTPITQTFTAASVAFDNAPPRVLLVAPAAGALSQPLSSTIRWIFSEPIDPLTVPGVVTVVDQNSLPVTGTVTLSAGGIAATFEPTDIAFVPQALTTG